MLLSECNIGTIVKSIYNDDAKRVGHVVGVTISDIGQVIPVVKWADGKESGIQAYNLVSLRDYDAGM